MESKEERRQIFHAAVDVFLDHLEEEYPDVEAQIVVIRIVRFPGVVGSSFEDSALHPE